MSIARAASVSVIRESAYGSRSEPIRARVDVERAVAHEPAEKHPQLAREVRREARRRADRDDPRQPGEPGLLNELERRAAAHACVEARQREAAGQKLRSDCL